MKKICLFLWFAVFITFSNHAQYYFNYSAVFNGSSSYVAVPSSNEILLPCSTGKITIEAWINPTSISNYPTICGKRYLSSFWFGINVTGSLRLYPQGGTYMDGNGIIPLNKWTHVAATFNGDTARLYINGVLDKESVTFSGPIGNNTDSLFIGCDRDGAVLNYFFKGEIDNLRIWCVSRTLKQINETMFMPLQIGGDPNKINVYNGLIASYNFDGSCWDWSGSFDNGTAHHITYNSKGSDPLTYCDFNNHLILDGKSYCSARNSNDFNATTTLTIEAHSNWLPMVVD